MEHRLLSESSAASCKAKPSVALLLLQEIRAEGGSAVKVRFLLTNRAEVTGKWHCDTHSVHLTLPFPWWSMLPEAFCRWVQLPLISGKDAMWNAITRKVRLLYSSNYSCSYAGIEQRWIFEFIIKQSQKYRGWNQPLYACIAFPQLCPTWMQPEDLQRGGFAALGDLQPWPWQQPSTSYCWPDGPILAATEKHQPWGLGPKTPASHITAELQWFSSFLLIKLLWLLSQQHEGRGGKNMSTSGLAAGCSAWSWVLAQQCPQGSGGTGATIRPSPMPSDD